MNEEKEYEKSRNIKKKKIRRQYKRKMKIKKQ